MKEFTFDTLHMSNITMYTAANTTFHTSNMRNITLYTATNTSFNTSDLRNKGLKSDLFCLYTHINRMKHYFELQQTSLIETTRSPR